MTSIRVGSRDVPVVFRRNARARRLLLRIDQTDGSILLVLPTRASETQALAFARGQEGWIAAHLAAMPAAMPFVDGMELPLLGRPHRICHDPAARRGVWAEDGVIHVSGKADHLARRLTDWLKIRARQEISGLAHSMAAGLGRTLGRISLKDTRSRWGSCTVRGDLAFSWRLVLAPEPVMRYVVAHEVAHLVEMNHSPAFWRVVDSLVANRDEARAWLKRHGGQLHRYGTS